jgi:hypothetical protein
MANRKKMVVGVFRDRLDAERAFDALLVRGYTESEINVLMSDTTRAAFYAHLDDEKRHKHHAGTHATEGMGVGGAVGTAVGAALGAAAAIGTVVVLGPLGLVIAGPIAGALAGGGAGAVTGGLVGLLAGAAIPEQNARAYEEVLREGGVVLGVVPHNSKEAGKIEELFTEHNGENVCYC